MSLIGVFAAIALAAFGIGRHAPVLGNLSLPTSVVMTVFGIPGMLTVNHVWQAVFILCGVAFAWGVQTLLTIKPSVARASDS